MTSRSLLDIVMVSNKDIVKPWGDLDLTISDQYLVYIVLDMKVPKPPPVYITTFDIWRHHTSTLGNCEINGLSGWQSGCF